MPLRRSGPPAMDFCVVSTDYEKRVVAPKACQEKGKGFRVMAQGMPGRVGVSLIGGTLARRFL